MKKNVDGSETYKKELKEANIKSLSKKKIMYKKYKIYKLLALWYRFIMFTRFDKVISCFRFKNGNKDDNYWEDYVVTERGIVKKEDINNYNIEFMKQNKG